MIKPTRTLGAISLAAVVAAFGAVSVAHAGPAQTATTKCNTTGPCHVFENESSGNALQAITLGEGRALLVQDLALGGDGIDSNGTYIGVIGRAAAGGSGYPFVGTDQNSNDLFYIDGYGDVAYTGSIFQFSKTRDGNRVASYASQTTTRTLEDVGSAQLSNGAAIVTLDPTFARSIDLQSPYHVFLTPGGDTKGLYVAQKSPTTFIVRETQGGRGTLQFDYRIVATQLGGANQRMGSARVPLPPVTHH